MPAHIVIVFHFLVVNFLLLPSCSAEKLVLGPHEAKAILNLHNEYRRQESAADMYRMYWNVSLQQRAENWAKKCLFKHESNPDLGENLFFDTDHDNDVFLRGMKAWHDEKSKWGYTDQGCRGTCHYTQVIWSYTTTVGCSAHICPSLSLAGRLIKNAMYLVCYYYPRGNFIGQFPFSRGQSCSGCDKEDTCSDGLCVSSGPESKLAPDFVKSLLPQGNFHYTSSSSFEEFKSLSQDFSSLTRHISKPGHQISHIAKSHHKTETLSSSSQTHSVSHNGVYETRRHQISHHHSHQQHQVEQKEVAWIHQQTASDVRRDGEQDTRVREQPTYEARRVLEAKRRVEQQLHEQKWREEETQHHQGQTRQQVKTKHEYSHRRDEEFQIQYKPDLDRILSNAHVKNYSSSEGWTTTSTPEEQRKEHEMLLRVYHSQVYGTGTSDEDLKKVHSAPQRKSSNNSQRDGVAPQPGDAKRDRENNDSENAEDLGKYLYFSNGKVCADRHPDCERWATKCHRSGAVILSCPMTCGKCGKHLTEPQSDQRFQSSYHAPGKKRNPKGYHVAVKRNRQQRRQRGQVEKIEQRRSRNKEQPARDQPRWEQTTVENGDRERVTGLRQPVRTQRTMPRVDREEQTSRNPPGREQTAWHQRDREQAARDEWGRIQTDWEQLPQEQVTRAPRTREQTFREDAEADLGAPMEMRSPPVLQDRAQTRHAERSRSPAREKSSPKSVYRTHPKPSQHTQARSDVCRDDPKHVTSCKFWFKKGYCQANMLIKTLYCRWSCASCG